MKAYAAIASKSVTQQLPALRGTEYPWVLTSFIYDNGSTLFKELLAYPMQARMIDSGAHTAFTKGNEISLDRYIAYAADLASEFPDLRVTNLDVIPGRAKRFATKREMNKAIKQSIANASQIRDAGLRVIEVYHLFEPLKVWEEMLERRQPGETVGIGGLTSKMVGADIRQGFGDAAFKRLHEVHGSWQLIPPVHAFGMSSDKYARRYPLASFDSSSWMGPGRWAMVLNKRRLGKRRDPQGSRRLYHNDVAVAEINRILRYWIGRAAHLERYWQERGVTIEEEGGALVNGGT